jgi:hypothetical protein
METLNPNICVGDRVIVVGLTLAQNDVGRVATVVQVDKTWYNFMRGQETQSLVPYQVKFDDGKFHWFIHNRLKAL